MNEGKKTIIALVSVILIVLIAWGVYLVSPTVQKKVKTLVKSAQEFAQNGTFSRIGEELFSTPLKGGSDAKDATLTRAGVISHTNQERTKNGQVIYIENELLNAAAELKLKDMFNKQYFEHVSPEGNGPGYLAEQVDYSYIVIGENLALGNFKDDAALVQAWMDSPGHRANIVHDRFKEIGVAVGQGEFEGKQVWLAVQEFGAPSSECPTLNTQLKAKIDADKTTVTNLGSTIESRRAEIQTMSRNTPAEREAYNAKVEEYNRLVAEYDTKLGTLKANIEKYNAQVQAYNKCIKG